MIDVLSGTCTKSTIGVDDTVATQSIETSYSATTNFTLCFERNLGIVLKFASLTKQAEPVFDWDPSLSKSDQRLFMRLLYDALDRPFNSVGLRILSENELCLVAAWPAVRRQVVLPAKSRRNDVWGWLRFSARDWERLANTRVVDWSLSFQRMTETRAIRPDGSLAAEVEEHILTRVKKLDPNRASIDYQRRQ